jgi:hypothetical protein
MNKKEWQGAAVTLLFQADSYAQVGDEANALNCCARLPDKFWTPGYEGAPAAGRRKSPKNYAESQRKPASGRDGIARLGRKGTPREGDCSSFEPSS